VARLGVLGVPGVVVGVAAVPVVVVVPVVPVVVQDIGRASRPMAGSRYFILLVLGFWSLVFGFGLFLG